MTTREILIAAADYIEKHGHKKGQYGGIELGRTRLDPTVNFPACAMGAIMSVTVLDGPPLSALRDYLGGPVAQWNDHPSRTAAEVIAALRGAAEACQ